MSPTESSPLLPGRPRQATVEGHSRTKVFSHPRRLILLSCLCFGGYLWFYPANPLALLANVPLDDPAALIPFPFEKPFSCHFDDDEGKPWRPPECAFPDPAPFNGNRLDRLLSPIDRVDHKTNRILDVDGRERYFRGLNVAYKIPPYIPLLNEYHPSLSFSRSDIRLFARLGLNVVRLGVPWAAIQPTQPKKDLSGTRIQGHEGFNEDYLSKVLQLVRTCAEEGLHVLVSAHQDLYAAPFCGNGMPAWAITSDTSTWSFPRPVHGFTKAFYDDIDPLPNNLQCREGATERSSDDWGRYYVSDAVTRAFWGLYNNEGGIRDDFAQAWAKVASVLRDEPNVLGYELLNEPFVAAERWWQAVFAFMFHSRHAYTEYDFLQPLYTSLTKAIRAVDPRSLIFFEPSTGNAGGNGFIAEGFLDPKNGSASKTVMAYHVYGKNLINRVMKNEEGQMKTRLEQVQRLGSGTMITEFDVEYGRLGVRAREIERTMKVAESNAVSWIGWQYKEFFRISGSPPTGSLIDPVSGFLRSDMAALFARPYVEAVAGTLISSLYDPTSTTFRMMFISNGADGDREVGLTVIRVSEDTWSYGRGFKVLLGIMHEEGDPTNDELNGPERALFWEKVVGQRGMIRVAAPGYKGSKITVTISPKQSDS